MIRGERLIKLRNSWFSTKTILVVRYVKLCGKVLLIEGGLTALLILKELKMLNINSSQTYNDKVLSQKGYSPE